jgi:hypothetical protein
MREMWVKPDFVTVCVNGECTAYAGVEEAGADPAVSSGLVASETVNELVDWPSASKPGVAACGKGVV